MKINISSSLKSVQIFYYLPFVNPCLLMFLFLFFLISFLNVPVFFNDFISCMYMRICFYMLMSNVCSPFFFSICLGCDINMPCDLKLGIYMYSFLKPIIYK